MMACQQKQVQHSDDTSAKAMPANAIIYNALPWCRSAQSTAGPSYLQLVYRPKRQGYPLGVHVNCSPKRTFIRKALANQTVRHVSGGQ